MLRIFFVLGRYYKQKPRAPTERVDSRKGIEDSSRRYIGFRSNPQALHNSMGEFAGNETPRGVGG